MRSSTTSKSSPTPQQQAAIAARGNVLVSAGAGAGKTRTLVDRCLDWLLNEKNPGSIDQVLMVTFTEAAAAEMRHRLRLRIEDVQKSSPSPHLAEQLALLDTAWISTLHSFCFTLVREHFYDLGLDPQTIVLPGERAQLLARQAMDAVLRENYTRDTPAARAIQDAIQSLGGDSDFAARALVLRLHHYAQTLPEPEKWIASQIEYFQKPSPDQWCQWLMDTLTDNLPSWIAFLRAEEKENPTAKECATALDALQALQSGRAVPALSQRRDAAATLARESNTGSLLHAKPSLEQFAVALEEIARIESAAKTKFRKPLENFFAETGFLRTVCTAGKSDPLEEDWKWSAPSMLALLDLTQQFNATYAAAKREAAGLDFHDLEQFALRLLREPDTGKPSPIALRWRAKLRLIFVDEFQDINGAQDAIIHALGGEDDSGSRFLVGDIKQSIYRFRLADPRIFLRYHRHWQTQDGANVLALSENFRSHQGILEFVNALFSALMRPEIGGLHYDEDAHLRSGLAGDVAHPSPKVELILRRTGGKSNDESENSEAEPVSATAVEARIIGQRLMELKSQDISLPGQPSRPATWSDMVILLRSPRHKVETYVKEFARMGIPLAASRGGFYESLEVCDLLNLLQILDNPSQDLPLLGVLCSPLVGLSPDELASIRLAEKPGRFWRALARWSRANPAHEHVEHFLQKFRAWRRLSRLAGVSQLLETIVAETGYGEIISNQPGAAANISRLIYLTRQFDGFRGEGLYRFLQFVEAQQENEIEVEPAGQPVREAVRLMSIHQSKGLEFPIVILPDLAKRFNLDDLRGRAILDEEYGLCPQVKPPGHYQFYPSLPHWLAQRRQRRETYGEEMRLLYVAMTRAAGRLILCGTARGVPARWLDAAARGLRVPDILAAGGVLDWIGSWLLLQEGEQALDQSGANSLLIWKIVEAADPIAATANTETPDAATAEADLSTLRQGRLWLDWRYPFADATRRAAKTSVTAVRRMAEQEDGDESELFFALHQPLQETSGNGKLSAAEIGVAHHTFLENISLEDDAPANILDTEAARMQQAGILTKAQAGSLDFDALTRFWQSDLRREIVEHRENVRRELAFTARFSPAEIARIIGQTTSPAPLSDEFIIVQGAIDLAVFLPNEIWILDFKTDHISPAELQDRVAQYRPQIELYAQAISRIHNRPVTRRLLHFLALNQTISISNQKNDNLALDPGAFRR